MGSYTIVIAMLAVAIGLYPLASKFNLPYPVLQMAAGIAVGFIPGFEGLSINPEVVFLIFLPPMLYDAAYNISNRDFRQNINTISLLAITLVFITTTGIAVVARYCIPGMTWPLAFVLGAILSPPDAIAASGVTKGLSLPHRSATILEGESLINDASALVAFRFAVASVAGSAFVFWKAGLLFLVSLGGGLLAGWIMWKAFALINRRFRLNSSVIVSLNLMLPFVAYLVAEELHVSGVIAVVTVGLAISGHKHKFTRQVRVQSKSVWDTAIFILGGLIFLMIGLELPHVMDDIPRRAFLPLLGTSVLIFIVALAIRMAVVFWHKRDSEQKIERFKERFGELDETSARWKRFDRRVHRRADWVRHFEPLAFRDCFIIGWSGMRGIVSLAAALSLPLLMSDGSAFPMRNSIIFVSVTTVILMLVVQGLGLPVLMKILRRKECQGEKQ